ncbi:FUSC family protein [Clostridium celatum]|uniref:FUSC family protein n=1 Tax=Clostridium celatum TaxID=36834 RepID=UPI002912E3A9|nr:FUSC family protein [Clostridium celatum]MDU6296740.1 FUSC family protein [Clostridium celatum]
MFEKIIRKYNINTRGMVINGSVALIIVVIIAKFLGEKNIMLAIPLALTSAVLGRQNLYVKPVNKMFKFIIIDIIIVICAFIASLNMWSGIIVDLLSIFLIIYMMVSPYDLTFYKPFLMLYIFSQYSKISILELPSRIMVIVIGLVVILVVNYIKKINEKDILGNSIRKSMNLIKEQLENISKESYDNKLEEKCSIIMRGLAYRIYITRYRKYFTTKLGTIQFNLYMNIEYLNLYLKEIQVKFARENINEDYLKNIRLQIDNIIEICSENKVENNEKTIDDTYYEYKYCNKDLDFLQNIIKEIFLNIKRLKNINIKDINKIYKEWERDDFDKTSKVFKEYLRVDSIRFKFAMRMAVVLTIALFSAEVLGFYKIIWAVITVMSVMQPYYEDTIKKTKDRIIGNVVAIIFTGVIINIINTKYFTITILVISTYLLFAFKDYSKISLFAAISSICLSSLSESINILIFYRVIYVIVGLIIVLIANKFIFPYRLKDGLVQLKEKIIRYDNYFIESIKENLVHKNKENRIRDLIVHITLLNEKLYLRNLQCKDKKINEFINLNNNFIVKIGYDMLINDNKNKKEKIDKEIYEMYRKIN